MKHVGRLGVALLAFVIGVAVAPIHFYREASGYGKVIDGGGGYGITVYTSSYFVKLWSAHDSYVSPEKADQVFNEYLSQAVKVIEVGPKLDREGAVVGRRAMVLFDSPETSCYYTQILSTDGRRVDYIYSTSALHVKEFEKQQRSSPR